MVIQGNIHKVSHYQVSYYNIISNSNVINRKVFFTLLKLGVKPMIVTNLIMMIQMLKKNTKVSLASPKINQKDREIT